MWLYKDTIGRNRDRDAENNPWSLILKLKFSMRSFCLLSAHQARKNHNEHIFEAWRFAKWVSTNHFLEFEANSCWLSPTVRVFQDSGDEIWCHRHSEGVYYRNSDCQKHTLLCWLRVGWGNFGSSIFVESTCRMLICQRYRIGSAGGNRACLCTVAVLWVGLDDMK